LERKLLNFTASLPSRFDTQISDDPERSDPKTIRLLSGDMSGCRSSREIGNSSAVMFGPDGAQIDIYLSLRIGETLSTRGNGGLKCVMREHQPLRLAPLAADFEKVPIFRVNNTLAVR
jgi:hypothetical protein